MRALSLRGLVVGMPSLRGLVMGMSGLRGLALPLFVALSACGGGTPAPQVPDQPPPEAAVEPFPGVPPQAPGVAAPVAAPPEAPVAPPPVEVPAERPRMSDAARGPYGQGLSAFGQGDLAGAKAAFQQATQADPRSYQAFYSLGSVLERLGDSGALAAYRQAFTVQSDYAPAIVAHGMLLAKRSPGDADAFLTGKRGALPSSAAVLGALAEVKSMARDTASAQQLAQEALKKDSDYRPAMVTLARDHYRNRRLDLAQYALTAILDGFGEENPARDPNNAEAHYLRALILKEEGRRAAAITELKKTVDLRPDMVDAAVQLAAFYLEAGNGTDAQPLLERALRYDASNVIAKLNLGDCYRLAGRSAEAKAHFDWVVLHDASLAQAHYDLALLYLFSPTLPGLDPKRQADAAIAEITKYQALRGKPSQAQADDSDELLSRAKQKLADLDAQNAANEPAAAPGGSAKPASSAAPAAPAAPPNE